MYIVKRTLIALMNCRKFRANKRLEQGDWCIVSFFMSKVGGKMNNRRKIIAILLAVSVFLTLSSSFAVTVEAKSGFNPYSYAQEIVAKKYQNKTISSTGGYSMTIRGTKYSGQSYWVSYIPNKGINTAIKNLEKSKVNDTVGLLTGLIPRVGAGFAIGSFFKNRQIDSMIKELKNIKKKNKNAMIEIRKTGNNPRSYVVKTWNGKTVMKKNYKKTYNGTVYNFKSNVKYGK